MGLLASRFSAGDVAALARAITLSEAGDPRTVELLVALSRGPRRTAATIGITGAPGVGKSTLVDELIHAARARGKTVSVIAVDPSSQFSGGAILGDRVRMESHLGDSGVFIRSIAARGVLGGLGDCVDEALWLFAAFGFDETMVETVGIGQSELDVASVTETTILVLTPGMGDNVQIEKAGVMEIADVFVVNKADQPGADAFARDLRRTLQLGPPRPWQAPIVMTTAIGAEGIDDVWRAVEAHRRHLDTDSTARAVKLDRPRRAAARFVAARAHAWAIAEISGSLAGELEQGVAPAAIGRRLCEKLGLPLADPAAAGGVS
jgi:LAO/AO transport system kinase